VTAHEPLSLWDLDEGRRRRDAALEAVADPPWQSFAVRALERVARRQPFVTSDDVWAELDAMGIPRPGEARAMGPVMLGGIRAEILAPHGFAQAGDPRHHASIMRVYRSLLESRV